MDATPNTENAPDFGPVRDAMQGALTAGEDYVTAAQQYFDAVLDNDSGRVVAALNTLNEARKHQQHADQQRARLQSAWEAEMLTWQSRIEAGGEPDRVATS
jgi:hypothetical protein